MIMCGEQEMIASHQDSGNIINCLEGVRKVRIVDRLEVPQSISKLGSSQT
jgi:hypothetical protein